MRSIITTALVFVALAATIIGVDSAPREILIEKQESSNVCSNNGLQSITKWPRNVVPYVIDSNFTDVAKTHLMRSMYHLENISCVLFIPRTDEQDYAFFKLSSRCCSHFGKTGHGKQEVYFNNNCLREGININRVLHNLIGGTSNTPVDSSDSESSSSDSESAPRGEDWSNVILSQSAPSTCTNSCLSCMFLQPPSIDGSGSSYGVITSQNYPNHYPTLHDCRWKLIAPDGYFITLQFLDDIELEGGAECKYDYLDILFLDSYGELLLSKKKYCGDKSASILNSDLSSANAQHPHTVVVQFHSDNTYTGTGFQLAYNLETNSSDPCSINNGGCEQMCTNNGYIEASCSCREGFTLTEDGFSCERIDLCNLRYRLGGCQQRCSSSNGTYRCFCKPGYRLADDQRTCQECNGIYNDSQGIIKSQNFPLAYPYEQNCKWTVEAWPDHYLRISITNMDIYPTERCTGDFLKVEKGEFPYQNRLCGHYSQISYIVNGSMYIRFRSKTFTTNYGGFQLEYTRVPEDELSSIERDFVRINNRYISYDNRIWT